MKLALVDLTISVTITVLLCIAVGVLSSIYVRPYFKPAEPEHVHVHVYGPYGEIHKPDGYANRGQIRYCTNCNEAQWRTL